MGRLIVKKTTNGKKIARNNRMYPPFFSQIVVIAFLLFCADFDDYAYRDVIRQDDNKPAVDSIPQACPRKQYILIWLIGAAYPLLEWTKIGR